MGIRQEPFGLTSRGEEVSRYIMVNSQGMEVAILNIGGIIHSIRVFDRNGKLGDVVLGCDTVSDYELQDAYFGAICGRFSNRINKGQFSIAGEPLQLACNNNKNHLHGGEVGYSQRIWSVSVDDRETEACLYLRYFSEDGEEGYPGNLDIQVTYTLNENNELVIDYRAETDRTTVVNLTNHSYFNLRSYGSSHEHELTLLADHYIPIDATAIPTGEIARVADTPMDFRQGKLIGEDIGADFEQVTQALGFDHCWVLNSEESEVLKRFARVREPESGRVMTVSTTQPGVQFYSGNYLQGLPAKEGNHYHKHDGFCLETQHFPDSPNQPHFPSTELQPGELYQHTTVYAFSVAED